MFGRILAPILCRPAGIDFFPPHMETVDVSLGGARIYSGEPMRVGSFVKLDLLVPNRPPVTCTAEVMWVDELPLGAGARFDMGLRFVQIDAEAREVLLEVLDLGES